MPIFTRFGDKWHLNCYPRTSQVATKCPLLHLTTSGLHDSLLPNEIQQSVSRAGHWLLAVLRVLLLSSSTRMDDVYHDDAHYHGNKGGPEVVGDGHDAEAARALGVQGS